MENKQFKLCLEVLRRFHKAGLLTNIILVGSWCLYFYKEYFYGVYVVPLIRTRDIDFLVPLPPKMKKKADISGILSELGFVTEFVSSKGYQRLGHPDLIIEFLVPERGKGLNKPYHLPQIGMNAQPLRFLDFLAKNIIEINVDGLRIKLPHPIAYALHKLIILGRRTKKEKAAKDRDQALMLLHHVLKHEKPRKIKEIFLTMPKKWQDKIFKALKKLDEEEILSVLSD
ncbi:MAG: nucleotidyltransferase domain-containing protein [Candidatus Margulisbacteria bacterium]|nr:nucleotidyltransferase domain-containing protein [Candidatus Margulisiibacteriota bacterium]